MCAISIIMPAFNASSFIGEAIESILQQSYDSFEFIIVDDGSTDDTVEIIQAYRDKRIRLLLNGVNKGVAFSLNRGIKNAKGRYIARMDADDIALAERLKVQYDFMEAHADIDICSSWMFAGDKVAASGKELIENPLYVLAERNFLFHPTVMMRKSFLEEHHLCYNEDYPCAEDYKLWVEAAKKGAKFYTIPQALIHYRLSPTQESQRKKEIMSATAGRIQDEVKAYLSSEKVSVIMPVFNMENTVAEAIESILQQTYNNFELIIVDDCSTDKTVNVVETFTDKRIRLIRNDERKGNYVRRNQGIDIAKGKYIAVMDADDISLPGRFEKQIRFLRANSDYLAVGSDIVYFSKEGVSSPQKKLTQWEDIKEFLKKDNPCTHPSLMVRSDVFTRYGIRYDERYLYSADYNLLIDISKHGKIANLPDVLLKYRSDNVDKISLSKQKEQRDCRNLIRKEQFGDTINLFILSIRNQNPSGVVRYIEQLKEGLKNHPNVEVHTITFFQGTRELVFRPEGNDFTVYYPPHKGDMLQKHPAFIYDQLNHLFAGKENIILHLHTLNLIDLAVYIKAQIAECRIISHLHCIPWKGLYNSNRKRFNELYKKSIEAGIDDSFITTDYERKTYTHSDKVVCVTENAKRYVKDAAGVDSIVIPNGIEDAGDGFQRSFKDKEVFDILYVGSLNAGKGIFFIHEAVNKVAAAGYKVRLNIAGAYDEKLKHHFSQSSYVKLLGNIPFDQLREQYTQADCGIIASLQEQCSYAAIEMAMFGLPIITTAVDGLDEMFTGKTAIKIKPLFSENFSLYVDTNELADKIIGLINDKERRKELSENVRKLYEERFGVEGMVEKTVGVYREGEN
ncbi:glycosyltransferase [Paludibacter sp. 221]|uniref:glycosyltransferase n=1 Tax=Paludibacter sp. 221 TaxID=2302939 RepID=UPI0013D42DA0|nr:glycosyltransferase [Paludibacter sp. 221]NDV46092.1 glycosyltransferase [Paludibacter sp. 221]